MYYVLKKTYILLYCNYYSEFGCNCSHNSNRHFNYQSNV